MEAPPSSVPRPDQAMSALGAWSALVLALATGLVGGRELASHEAGAGRSLPSPSASSSPAAQTVAPPAPPPLPRLLSETGLLAAGGTAPEGALLAFSPQYPLWSDGASKRRWVFVPAGESIDGSDPDAWVLPSGTRFWKEFSFGGERVETRYSEKLPDGSFRFATYRWDRTRGDAVLVDDAGERDVHALRGGEGHDLPSRSDCLTCHEGRRSQVLGFNALQLSPDRDALAPHAEPLPPEAVDLPGLVERGLLRGFPEPLLQRAPRIAAESPIARAAQGYLYGNCAGCHNASGPLAALDLTFDQSVLEPSALSYVAAPSRFRLPGERASLRLAPGRPQQSAIWFRLQSRAPIAQMPPLGTELVDREAERLISSWISSLNPGPQAKGP